jgi:phosphonate transport system permease protein
MTRPSPADIGSIKEAALADAAEFVRRYPSIFKIKWALRFISIAIPVAAIALLVFGFTTLGISIGRVLQGFGRLGEFALLMMPPSFGAPADLRIYSIALAQTLAIAFLGTLLAAIAALPFGFLAARNIIPNVFAHFALRRGLDVIRSVDVLVWALIWINVVGLGPFAGVLAIATSDFGSFGKLFSEAVEAADNRPVEPIIASGGTPLDAVRSGYLPQLFPVFLSQMLYFFESNTRSSTIVGIVGAGGIGQQFSEQIRVLEWQHVAFLVLLVLVAVAVIDYLSSWLRAAMIGRRA